MTRDFSNRIPVKQIKNCQTWAIPEIDDGEQILPCAEKEDRERRVEEERRMREIVGEEVDLSFVHGAMTADQLGAIVEAAQKEGYGEGFQQGYDEGKKTGHKDGLQKGLDEGRQTIIDQGKRLAHLIEHFLNPFQTQTNHLESLVLNTVKHLVQSIVQRELLVDSGQIISFVQQALEALPAGSENVQVFLNPDDIVLLENFKKARHANWQLHSDDRLAPGGCRIETKQSVVDFSVEERLRILTQQFINGELAGDNSVEENAIEDVTEYSEEIEVDDDFLLNPSDTPDQIDQHQHSRDDSLGNNLPDPEQDEPFNE